MFRKYPREVRIRFGVRSDETLSSRTRRTVWVHFTDWSEARSVR